MSLYRFIFLGGVLVALFDVFLCMILWLVVR